MKTIEELQILIIDWAKEKNLNDTDKQYLKILEEVGETARAILKNDTPEIKDGIGDIAVTIIIYYNQKGYDLKLNWVVRTQNTDKTYFEDILYNLSYMTGYELMNLEDLALLHGTTLKECLNLAWNEIKDRQGKTINGTFVKN